MGEIITRENERIVRFFKAIDNMSEGLEKMVVNRKPQFSGERFFTDKEVSAKLKVSRRTLQDWRTNGQIAYIALGGKTLYRESEIRAMLEKNHRKAFE